ncbi:peptidyl-prolyl cis-trans isomerase [Candidatus Sumerlaeota bacterium]|nr:peptidyl-prolyl cis-trans isomerase [Candidatus Sumerlaeota bacterium]
MLRQLRSPKVVKRVMRWILILIIPSFVTFYGWQSLGDKEGRYGREGGYAHVKDRWMGLRWRPISPIEQEFARRAVESRYAAMLRNQVPQSVIEQSIRGAVGPIEIGRESVDAYCLQRLAQEKGFEVSEREVSQYLAALLSEQPVENIREFLRREGMSEEQLIASFVYKELLDKARLYVQSHAKVSLFELWQEYLIGSERIQIQYVRIPTETFHDSVKATTDALRNFYNDHVEAFRIRERVNFRYLGAFRSDIEKEVEITTAALVAYYEKNKEKLYKQKRSSVVRHILVKVADATSATIVKAAEQKILDIAKQIEAGADFMQMADKVSEDPANADPSDPTIKYAGMVQGAITEDGPCPFGEEFRRAALALARDQVSSPVRTSAGFHLIKAQVVTTSGTRPFDDVRRDIEFYVRNEEVGAKFRERGDQLRKMFTERSYSTLESFAQAARQHLPYKTEIKETGLVDLSTGRLPEIGSISEILDFIKELRRPGDFTESVLNTRQAYVVLELKDKQASHIPPFESIVDEVRAEYVTSQTIRLARATAAGMTKSKSLDELRNNVEKIGLKLTQTDLFTRDKVDEALKISNLDPEFLHSTLGAKVGSVYSTFEGQEDHPRAYVVWYLEKREPPSQDQFRIDLPMVRREYMAHLQAALIEEWLYDLRHRFPARINPVYLRAAEEQQMQPQ